METTEHRIGHGHNQSLLVIDTDQRAPVCTVWHSGHRLGDSVEEQQWPGLKRLFCLVGKKLVAVPNQRSLVLYAENAGVSGLVETRELITWPAILRNASGFPSVSK